MLYTTFNTNHSFALTIRQLMCLVLSLFCFNGAAQETSLTKILWLTPDQRFIDYVTQSKRFNVGIDTASLLLKALNNYHVELVLRPLSRIDMLLRSNENVCVFNRMKTPMRAQENLYSLPFVMYPTQRLYELSSSRKIPQKLLNDQQQLISLKALFQHFQSKNLGVTQGASMGLFLDQQIAQVNPRQVFTRAGNHRMLSMHRMLYQKRVDYILQYPAEIKREQGSMAAPTALRSVAIANSPSLVLGHVACSKTATSQRFIKDVDRVFKQLYQSDTFYQAHSRYLVEADLAQFKRDFDSVFIQATKG